MTAIALVDCNNFFVSCERVFNPQLKNKPAVVLSSNDGCVISRSDEAKQIGIPMGAPAYKFQGLLTKYNVRPFYGAAFVGTDGVVEMHKKNKEEFLLQILKSKNQAEYI